MTLRTLMQAGPAKANELFTRLADTSEGAVKTRERLFAELKTELEAHVGLEEQYLFPVLRKHVETKELAVAAIKDNKDLRAALSELETLPKNDDTFLAKLSDLRKAFRQHARDETKELLPAVQKALSEEQVQDITEKMETSLAEAEQAKHDQAEERRAVARQEREQAEELAQQEEAAERERQEQAEAQARQEKAAEREQQAAARRARETAQQAAEAVVRTAELATNSARQVTKSVSKGVEQLATAASAPLTTGVLFWDMWLGMAGLQSSRSVAARGADASHADTSARNASGQEQVIPLAEEVLTVGTRKVNTGTTRVRRYVVETPVEEQVSLVREKVVVERRRPVTDKVSGEMLTELTVEVIETDEVPVVGKTVRLKEEVVIRTERTEHVETVRGTVRQDEVEVEHSNKRAARLHAVT
jgi:stress response protein YsnF/hemerythrin-like domain-containing protein